MKHNEKTTNTQDYIHVYTDGSSINDVIGRAVVSPMIRCTIKAYIGDSTTSTVYAAEFQGIRIALMIAMDDWSKGNRKQKLIIYIDNQATIRTVENLSGKSGACIVADIVYLIDCL